MIGILVDLLNLDDFYGVSKNIDIAKGVNKIPLTLKEGVSAMKREKAWLKK